MEIMEKSRIALEVVSFMIKVYTRKTDLVEFFC